MIGALLESFVRRVMAAPRAFTVLTVAIMVIGAIGASRITLEDDVRSLIAGADPRIGEQLEALSHFTAVDQMLLQLDGSATSPGPTPLPARLEAAAHEIAARLRDSGQFTEVRYEAGADQALHLADTLMPRRFAIDPRDPATLFAPGALHQSLVETREALLAPRGSCRSAI